MELITFWDRTKPLGDMVGTFLEKHEGGLFLGIDVSPVEETAKLLRARGFDLHGPEAANPRSF